MAEITIITPPIKLSMINLRELWEYRELLYNFIIRDVRIRYKQTLLGFLWVLLQPLCMMILFTILFGGFAKIQTGGIPYPIFCLSALLPWILFSEGLMRSITGMISNAGIITKVYFPRAILPMSSVLSPIVDFIIALVILIILMIYYGYIPTIMILLLPIFTLLTILTSFAIGLIMSAINVKYRDVQYTLPFLIQMGLYASPIVYPISMIPDQYQLIYGLNPMVGIIEGFRWILLGAPFSPFIFMTIGFIIIFIPIGLIYFKDMENYYADVV